MSIPERFASLFESNKAFADGWSNPASMIQLRQRAKENGGALIFMLTGIKVTCLDPLCVPEAFFGPNLRSAVIRNAGGRITNDVVRSILTLKTLAYVENVVIVHHTDCGMTHLTDSEIAMEAKQRTPSPAAVHQIEQIEKTDLSFGCFTAEEYEQALKNDVLTLKGMEAMEGINVFGMSFDLDSGLVSEVHV